MESVGQRREDFCVSWPPEGSRSILFHGRWSCCMLRCRWSDDVNSQHCSWSTRMEIVYRFIKDESEGCFVAQRQFVAINSSWPFCPLEGNIRQPEATYKMHQLRTTSVAALWWCEGCCTVTWSSGWLHEILLFYLRMGQSCTSCSLCQTELAHVTQSVEPGQKSVQHPPLVESEKILLPPLHIKLGLMKTS